MVLEGSRGFQGDFKPFKAFRGKAGGEDGGQEGGQVEGQEKGVNLTFKRKEMRRKVHIVGLKKEGKKERLRREERPISWA